jgi:tetratricopeptide (TPR) repeat protein
MNVISNMMNARKLLLSAVMTLFTASLFAQTPGGTDAMQNYRIGSDLTNQGRADEANVYYDKAIQICMDDISRDPSNMNAYAIMTWAIFRQRRYNDVIHWGERGLAQNANDYRIIETMGEAYFYLRDFGRSLSFMQRYVNAMPQGERAATAYFFMGDIYRNQGKFLHADIAYTTATNLQGGNYWWWFRLGSVRESAGDFAAAREAYEKAIALNPNHKDSSDGLDRVRRQIAAQ